MMRGSSSADKSHIINRSLEGVSHSSYLWKGYLCVNASVKSYRLYSPCFL